LARPCALSVSRNANARSTSPVLYGAGEEQRAVVHFLQAQRGGGGGAPPFLAAWRRGRNTLAGL